ncbi:class I SAM-dependent methyltransferase [Pseudoxanthomonas koreensis]|uniref:class I SAM-dependent methyltransferase n=1 Tax=Pseudoxanthomonas koreensis TaxID=266061 RepID=UPI00139180E2|nr:class I SAM-dependent methyltransferase [Pseudoxanthomonas koreensis]KAF1694169.1 methyltransferase [Pseudoxanthomonas koreensis]
MIRTPMSFASLLAIALAAAVPGADAAKPADAATVPAPDATLQAAIDGSWRDPANTARDQYRHPGQTLAFFGIKPDMTVVEISPGGGWYAEILAPYLKEHGKYAAAIVDPAAYEAGRQRDYYQKGKDGLAKKFADAPAQFDQATVVAYDPKAPSFGAPGSADMVVTFRNVHNWRGAGQAEGMFKGFYDVLKPGGVLGLAEHRAKGDVPADDKSGYVGQDQVIAMAEAAGFKLDATSEVNANPRDTKDHPNGVWTLPPSNNHPEAERAKYQAIGESDRMTLRFVKPRGE